MSDFSMGSKVMARQTLTIDDTTIIPIGCEGLVNEIRGRMYEIKWSLKCESGIKYVNGIHACSAFYGVNNFNDAGDIFEDDKVVETNNNNDSNSANGEGIDELDFVDGDIEDINLIDETEGIEDTFLDEEDNDFKSQAGNVSVVLETTEMPGTPAGATTSSLSHTNSLVSNLTQEENDDNKFNNSNEKAKRSSSIVWDYMKYVVDPPQYDENEQLIPPRKRLKTEINPVICNCGQEFPSHIPHNGTKGLLSHLTRCCTFYKSVMNRNNINVNSSKVQSVLIQSGSIIVNANLITYSDANARRFLVEHIVLDELPFHYVEKIGLKILMQCLRNEFKLISQQTVRRDIMEGYEKDREYMKKRVNDRTNSMLSFTTDIWSSGNKSFIAVTCHFIDKDFKLWHVLIGFEVFTTTHKGTNISDALDLIFTGFGIDYMLLFQTVMDNASNNSTAVIEFIRKRGGRLFAGGKYFHGRCNGHIIALVAGVGQDILKPATQALRKNVQKVQNLPKQKHIFETLINECDSEAIKALKFRPNQDVTTRWNSLSNMIVTSVPFRDIFTIWFDSNGECIRITCADWDKMININSILSPLRDITVALSFSDEPTIHKVYPLMVDLKAHIETCIGITMSMEDKETKEACEDMLEKFNKYYEIPNPTHIIAHMLDPQFKVTFLSVEAGSDSVQNEYLPMIRDAYKSYCDNLEVPSVVVQSSLNASVNAASVNSIPSTNNNSTTTIRKLTSNMGILSKSQMFLNSGKVNADNKSVIYNELEAYLSSPIENYSALNDMTILQWWKNTAYRYPTLCRFAASILAIPATSVPSECTFSRSGRILSKYRGSLLPATVKALMLWGDWLKAKLKYRFKTY